MSPPLPSICPLCHMVDRVQKVSGLVAASASTSVTTGQESDEGNVIGSAGSELGTVTTRRLHQEGSEQTRLSKLLSPPAEPPLEGARPGGTDIVAGLSALAICSLLGASLVAGITGQADISAYGMLLALAADVGVVVLLPRARARDKRIEEARKVERERWRKARANWEKLYYCWRDDIVYFPDDSKSATPASSMRTLIWK